MPGMPTVTRSAVGRRAPSCTSVFTKRSGGNGYGVGTRNGWARIVPASSSTEPLMPPPPQSIVRVKATPPVCMEVTSSHSNCDPYASSLAGEEGLRALRLLGRGLQRPQAHPGDGPAGHLDDLS